MNSLTLIGRLTKDAEAKETSIRLSLATNEGYNKETKKSRVHFVDVYAFNLSERLFPYLQKGKEVLIRNAVVSNQKTQNGYKTFISVYGGNGNLQLLGSKPKAEEERVHAREEAPQGSGDEPAGEEVPF